MGVFRKEEVAQYPGTILKSIISQLYKPKDDLKASKEIARSIKKAANIKKENPSSYYKVVGKAGEGGFARVFRC